MSHISKYKQTIRNPRRFLDVAKAKGYEVREAEALNVEQFGSNRVQAVGAVKLPGWRYEVALNSNGDLMYDHFGSAANSFELLGELVQTYNEEEVKASIPYDQVEHFYTEKLENGDKVLILEYE